MSVRTRAVVSGADGFAVHHVELDGPRSGEVLVRIEAVGVCHTDLVTAAGLGETAAVLGHEGCGVVEAVGPAVVTPTVGDRVVLTYAACGSCDRCTEGRRAYCRVGRRLNASGAREDGSSPVSRRGAPLFSAFFGQSSWAGHAVARADSCVVVGTVDDDDVDPAVAAPLGCGFLTGAGAVLHVLRPTPGDRVVVVGGGGVGLAAALVARQDGAEIEVVDTNEARRDVAARLGLPVVASLEDVRAGFGHVLDTTGRPDVVADALQRVDSCGTVVVVGLGRRAGEIDLADLLHGGKTLRGCIEGDADPQVLVPEVLARQARGLGLERLVTTYPLDHVADAIADQHAGHVVKPVLVP